MSANTEPLVVVSAQVPREQPAELERMAAEHDRSISWYLRQALSSYLEHKPGSEETAA